jgi:hypothetical protein
MARSRFARLSSRLRKKASRARRALWRKLRPLRKWAARRGRKLRAAAPALRIAAIAVLLLAAIPVANFIYHFVRKPTELLFPFANTFDKQPAETWQEYGALFREYATAAISPELLAALAQVEGAGNPVARTYWRWRLTWHPFAIYAPASSAVGMYQMTDAAFAEARRYCVRHHIVVTDGCWFSGVYSRILPGHAIELTAVYLDRNVAAILAGRPKAGATAQQKQDLAALVHLCGAGHAIGFARRGFRLVPGERCGDHDAATYVAKVNAMKQAFRRIAVEP